MIAFLKFVELFKRYPTLIAMFLKSLAVGVFVLSSYTLTETEHSSHFVFAFNVTKLLRLSKKMYTTVVRQL